MDYRTVDLCTCRFYHSHFKERNPFLYANLKATPGYREFTIELYAPQEVFGSKNPIVIGDKVSDRNTDEDGGDDIDLFEVLDVTYGITKPADSVFFDLHPEIKSVMHHPISVPDSTPAAPTNSDTPGDTTPEDNGENSEPNGEENNGENSESNGGENNGENSESNGEENNGS